MDQSTIEGVQKPSNPLISIVINIAIPALILIYLANDEAMGAVNGFLFALAFPLLYGLYELLRTKQVNWIAILGVVNVLLTGGIGLLKIDNHWLAIKEAAIPGLIGLVFLISAFTSTPLIKKLVFNNVIMQLDRVTQAITVRGKEADLNSLLRKATFILAASFGVSACLNYILAKWIVVSPSGTSAFNEELGRLTALSYPVIVIPSMIVMGVALFVLYRGIKQLTGLTAEEIFRVQ